MVPGRDSKTRADEVMIKGVLSLKEGATVGDVIQLLVKRKVTGLAVVDDGGKVVGVVSEYDIIKQCDESGRPLRDVLGEPVRFSREIVVVQPETPLGEVVRKFIETRVRRLPVVDESGKAVGIITRRDLMRVYYLRARLGA